MKISRLEEHDLFIDGIARLELENHITMGITYETKEASELN